MFVNVINEKLAVKITKTTCILTLHKIKKLFSKLQQRHFYFHWTLVSLKIRKKIIVKTCVKKP